MQAGSSSGLAPNSVGKAAPQMVARADRRNHFSLERHLIDRQAYEQRRSAALAEWQMLAN
jgi:hypothetical protein